MVEAVLSGDPVGSSARWVTSESEQVLDAQLFCFVQTFLDLFASHVGAGEVHEDVKTAVALDMAAEVKGDITCDTTSIPSDINPERVRLSHSLNTVKKVLDTCLSLGPVSYTHLTLPTICSV